MGSNGQDREVEWEAVDDAEQKLQDVDEVYQLCKESLRKDSMLFNQFGKIVKPRSLCSRVSWERDPGGILGKEKGCVPMARVRKQNPTMVPR